MAYINTGSMSAEQAAHIIGVLKERHATRQCPRCANAHFTLLEGFFNQPISGDYFSGGAFAYSQGPTVPSVVTVCSNCGFLSQHALGVLGLLPNALGSLGEGINNYTMLEQPPNLEPPGFSLDLNPQG